MLLLRPAPRLAPGLQFLRVSLASACLLISPTSAYCASDGALGAASTGSANISITIPTLLRIRRVQDQNLGIWLGSGDKAAANNVCVYTNAASGSYRVTLSGNGPGGSFAVSGPSSIPYRVKWNDDKGTSGSVLATAGQALREQRNAETTDPSCPTNNANYEVTIAASDLAGAKAGVYSGLLAIVIEPD